MTIIDGRVHVDWFDAVAMLKRRLDPARFIELGPEERLKLCYRTILKAIQADLSACLIAVHLSGSERTIFKVYDMAGNRDRLERIYESLIRRQAHHGTDEIRQWATQVALDIDANGCFAWEEIA